MVTLISRKNMGVPAKVYLGTKVQGTKVLLGSKVRRSKVGLGTKV